MDGLQIVGGESRARRASREETAGTSVPDPTGPDAFANDVAQLTGVSQADRSEPAPSAAIAALRTDEAPAMPEGLQQPDAKRDRLAATAFDDAPAQPPSQRSRVRFEAAAVAFKPAIGLTSAPDTPAAALNERPAGPAATAPQADGLPIGASAGRPVVSVEPTHPAASPAQSAAVASEPARAHPLTDGVAHTAPPRPVESEAMTSSPRASALGSAGNASDMAPQAPAMVSATPRMLSPLSSPHPRATPIHQPEAPRLARPASSPDIAGDATKPRAAAPGEKGLRDGQSIATTPAATEPLGKVFATQPISAITTDITTVAPDQTPVDGTAASADTQRAPSQSAALSVPTLASDTIAMRQGQAAASQVATAIVNDPGTGQIDLRLDPPDLGRVEIKLELAEDGLKATLSAERPVTADALRRHADILIQELRTAGFEQIDLSFSEYDHRERESRGGLDTSSIETDQAPSTEGEALHHAPASELWRRSQWIGTHSLDLTL